MDVRGDLRFTNLQSIPTSIKSRGHYPFNTYRSHVLPNIDAGDETLISLYVDGMWVV